MASTILIVYARRRRRRDQPCKRCCNLKTTVQAEGKVEFANPELEAGQTVDVVVLHDSGEKGRSIMEILNSDPERRLFQTAEEVRAYLEEEKASWGR